MLKTGSCFPQRRNVKKGLSSPMGTFFSACLCQGTYIWLATYCCRRFGLNSVYVFPLLMASWIKSHINLHPPSYSPHNHLHLIALSAQLPRPGDLLTSATSSISSTAVPSSTLAAGPESRRCRITTTITRLWFRPNHPGLVCVISS